MSGIASKEQIRKFEINKQVGVCDGLVYVSTLVGHYTQSFNQTLIYLGVACSYFVDVVNIYSQLTLSKEISLGNVGRPPLIS